MVAGVANSIPKYPMGFFAWSLEEGNATTALSCAKRGAENPLDIISYFPLR
jgi:hypothetical protein